MAKYESTVLVVEGEEADQILIRKAFRDLGLTGTIHVVRNAEEAIAYMMGEGQYADRAQYPYPTFIITDLHLPGTDGFTVLEHLKANPAWAIIPTVVLSGSSDPDDIKKSYMLGASSYHLKPAGFEGLRLLIKILHDYWTTCEVPAVDSSGKQLHTNALGRLGARFPQPSEPNQIRAHP